MKKIFSEKSFLNFIIKLFYVCLLIAPFILSIFNTGAYIFGYSFSQKFLIPFILTVSLLFYFFYIFCKAAPQNIDKKCDIRIIIVLAVSAFLLRLVCVMIVKSQPVSDFYMAYENATELANGIIDPNYQMRYALFNEWGFYSITLAGLFKLFSSSVFVGQVFNCILAAATACVLYIATKLLTQSYKVGIAASALFVLNPTIIIYTGVLTAEHIVIFLSSVCLLLLGLLDNFRKEHLIWKKIIKYYVMLGGVIGLMGAYRPVDFIYLIAFVIVEFVVYLPKNIKEQVLRSTKTIARQVLISSVTCIVVLISVCVVRTGCDLILKHAMEIEQFDDRLTGYGYVFYVGLGIDENGNNSKQPAKDFRAQYTGEASEFSRACYEKVLNDIKKYYYKYPKIFWDKFSTSWGRYGRYPESAYIEWSFYPEAILDQTDSETHPLLENYYPEISTILGQYYFVFMLLAAIGVFKQIKNKINAVMLLNALVIFGFMLVMLLGEAQGRYRSVLFAIISLFSGVGLKYLIDLVDRLPLKKLKID